MAEAATSALPEDLAALVAELERLESEAHALAGPLEEGAFNWQPDRGKAWSVAQCLDHLARANRLYLDALEESARRAEQQGLERRGALAPDRLGRWFIAQIEPPPRRRLPIPKKAIPASRCMKPATLAAFGGEQQRAIDLVRQLAAVDANTVKFRNPFAWGLRAFNLATGVLVIAAHERRHLLQARAVLSHPAFGR